MMARSLVCSLFAALALAGTATAQGVAVTPLAAPDLFSTGAGDTGLGADLWRGASAETFRTVRLIAASPAGGRTRP